MNAPQQLLNKPAPGTRLNLSHPLNRGLVGCWLFNEQSGMQAYDLSPYHNHGTLHGFNDPSSKDRSSLGLQFDGASTYVDCGNDPSLNITDAITIEAWVKFATGTYTYGGFIEKHLTNLGYTLALSEGSIRIRGGDGTHIIDSTITEYYNLRDGQWHYITITYDGNLNKFYCYLDGLYITYCDWSYGFGDNSVVSLLIGKYFSHYLNGTIDEVRIYNRALSAEEIKLLYQEPYCMFERGKL